MAPPRSPGGWLLLAAALLLLPLSARADDPYRFDLGEIEKRPYHWGGYLEFRPVAYRMDPDSALYRLQYPDQGRRDDLQELNARLQLEGSYERGAARLYIRTNTDYRYSSWVGGAERTAIYEGYGTLKPSDSWRLEIGKKNLKWGKGYAWNPVNFLDRGKDPGDPEQSLEGHWMATADYVRSFGGSLNTLAVTSVLLPVYDHLNDGFGVHNRLNAAAKLYLLLFDTDLDLIYVADGSRTARIGFDFSRNITTNFEIHGELAHLRDDRKRILEPSGALRTESRDTVSGLIGIRHLTAFDLTTILEYYRNGSGFGRGAMETYYRHVQSAYDLFRSTGDGRMLATAAELAAGGYGRANPMEDYLYLRLSQKEPFDLLYLTAALTTMLNLGDRSYSVTPELLYSGITNLELRVRFGWLGGGRGTEFGERPNDYRIELRAGYYF